MRKTCVNIWLEVPSQNGKKKVTAGDSKSKGCEMWASLQALLEQYRRTAEAHSRNVSGSDGSATRTGELQRILRRISNC